MLEIYGKHVCLLPFSEKHLHDARYFDWLTDIEVMRYIGREEYLRPVRFEVVQKYVEDLWRNPYCSFFAVHASEDRGFIGTAKLNYLNADGLKDRAADVGLMIGDKSRWGKGFGKDIIHSLSDYAFKTLSARKLTAGAMSANMGVVHAFKSVGYVEEGRLRSKILLGGEYLDHVLLGCFQGELTCPS